MSDWSEAIQGYTERNWEDLAEAFINLYSSEFDEFVSNKFFNTSLCDRLGVNEDGGTER